MVWKLDHILAGRWRIDYLWMEQGGRCLVGGQMLRRKDQPRHIH
jgi:hypothetical protein